MSSSKGKMGKILEYPYPDFTPDPRGLGCVYYDLMLKNKNKLAQIYGPTGEQDTYGDVLQRSVLIAITLREMGIQPGDFLSLCTFNHLDSCTPLIASFFTGAIMASVDPTLCLDDMVRLLKQAPPKVVFAIPESVELIEKTIEAIKSDTKIVVYGKTTKHIPFSSFLQAREEEAAFQPHKVKSLKDTAVIFFSSGTTGLPKGICLPHCAYLWSGVNAQNYGLNLDLSVAYASPYWSLFLGPLNNAMMAGGARLVYPRYDPNNAWDLFRYKLTTVIFNTLQILTMLKQGRPKGLDISGVQDIVLGGGVITLDQVLKTKQMFPETRVHLAYGQTEVSGLLSIFKPRIPKDLEFIATKPLSCGTGVAGISYKVLDPETEEILGPNQPGELRIKTEMQLTGYLNLDSSATWDSDGWLKTGDVVYYDEDLCFYAVDRVKEMFKFQSWHIVPAVIEDVLLSHPAVENGVVIGVPHEIDGDHPMGLVKLKASHQNVKPLEIEKYIEDRVPDRQRLRAGVKIVSGFPTTATGKIGRNKLRQMVVSGEI